MPLDHLGDVVDGIVITSSVGMLTLDVLGKVGGPACHNKELWSQSQLPWEHDTLVCNWLVSDNANLLWELSNQIDQVILRHY